MHERAQMLLDAGMTQDAEAGLLRDCMWSMHGCWLGCLSLHELVTQILASQGAMHAMLLPQPQLGADLEKCQREEAGRASAKVWVY